MKASAVLIRQPKQIELAQLVLDDLVDGHIAVEIEYSGISTGTEKLLWSGKMPNFPGMGYPLVPGYESVGRVIEVGPQANYQVGDTVFVPGAKCFGDIRGLFGGASSHVIVPQDRVIQLDQNAGPQGVLLALAATAYHVSEGDLAKQPDLIIGHGVVGRLLARIAVAKGKKPLVLETNEMRMSGAVGYDVIHPQMLDSKQKFNCICDASGDAGLMNTLISQLSVGGEIVLAGFYDQPISFMFAPAFMKEMRMRIAAQWQPKDLQEVKVLIDTHQLNLDGLITHFSTPKEAQSAYQTAFSDSSCLKMILDWKN